MAFGHSHVDDSGGHRVFSRLLRQFENSQGRGEWRPLNPSLSSLVQCYFGTPFEDRAASAFKKALPTLAWGAFVWFRSEPDRLLWLSETPFDITKRANL